jgi:hypothetical protein
MFERVRVARHPASLLHGKFPQCKVGTFLGGDEDLDGRVLSRRDVSGFDIVGMFDCHKPIISLLLQVDCRDSGAKMPQNRVCNLQRAGTA